MLITRRTLLKATGATLGAAPLSAFAFESNPVSSAKKPTLVVVFLRGGADGLNLVVPHGDESYRKLRPQLGIARPGAPNGALDLDGFFGLHPAAEALHPLFADGTAVALHALGHPANTRSHFEEQDRWETAVDEVDLSAEGWLNRHLQASPGRGPVRALALGDQLPRALRGKSQALALRGLSDLSFRGDPRGLSRTIEALSKAYAKDGATGGEGLVSRGGQASLDALRHLQKVAENPRESKVEFPNDDFGRRCRELSRLVHADLGLEVVELDLGGWDTHQYQGGAQGPYANNVRSLATGLAALVRDLEERLDDVLVVTLTEFGRTARQNGTGGTDHGWASCSLALGGPVRRASAGKARGVLGAWPGLATEQLNDRRDLAQTTDVRDVYAELLGFLGNEQVGEILPGHEVRAVGLI